MVFKYKNTMEDGTPCWEYFDNVRSANTFYSDGMKTNCVTLFFDDDAENGMVIPVEYEGYLMNDAGKTIEKIQGKIKLKEMLDECAAKIDLEGSPKL